MTEVHQRFEATLEVRTQLHDLRAGTSDHAWRRTMHEGDWFLPVVNGPGIPDDEFNARVRCLFDALRRHGPSLDAWLAHSALLDSMYGTLERMSERLRDEQNEGDESPDPIERVTDLVAPQYRRGVQRMIVAGRDAAMPYGPVYFAPDARVVAVRIAPHAPPSRLEGPVRLPYEVWHRVVYTVDATWGDISPDEVARYWRDFIGELRPWFGTMQRYAAHLEAMNEAARADDVIRAFLFRERIEGACDMPADALVDFNAGAQVLAGVAATLSDADRRFFSQFPVTRADGEPDDVRELCDATFGIDRATRSEAEAFSIRTLDDAEP